MELESEILPVGNPDSGKKQHALAPGVLEELKKANPRQESGRRKHKHFQWLTENRGYPKLREHLGSSVKNADWPER
ncbi:P63C domain-containing protein [Bradyrhizobium sp. Cp5.3]|uniref:P63C domain-containing protein n=1 Tax=Bradyrhizobium sp. Cp5.3 TaxID=443598 RepID=UPI000A0478BA